MDPHGAITIQIWEVHIQELESTQEPVQWNTLLQLKLNLLQSKHLPSTSRASSAILSNRHKTGDNKVHQVQSNSKRCQVQANLL